MGDARNRVKGRPTTWRGAREVGHSGLRDWAIAFASVQQGAAELGEWFNETFFRLFTPASQWSQDDANPGLSGLSLPLMASPDDSIFTDQSDRPLTITESLLLLRDQLAGPIAAADALLTQIHQINRLLTRNLTQLADTPHQNTPNSILRYDSAQSRLIWQSFHSLGVSVPGDFADLEQEGPGPWQANSVITVHAGSIDYADKKQVSHETVFRAPGGGGYMSDIAPYGGVVIVDAEMDITLDGVAGGSIYHVKNVTAALNLTLVVQASFPLEGSASNVVLGPGESRILFFDDTQWRIIGSE